MVFFHQCTWESVINIENHKRIKVLSKAKEEESGCYIKSWGK